MACFLVSGGEAIVVTAIRSVVKKNELEKGIVDENGKQLTDPRVTASAGLAKSVGS